MFIYLYNNWNISIEGTYRYRNCIVTTHVQKESMLEENYRDIRCDIRKLTSKK